MVKTNKGVKILVVALLLTLTMVCFFMFLLKIGKAVSKGNDSTEHYAATSYDFKNGSLTTSSEDYINNSEFTIGTLDALKNFSASVNSGCDFLNKTIELTKSINCGGASIGIGGGITRSIDGLYDQTASSNPFEGYFDGNGFTISNITYSSYHDVASGLTGGGWIVVWQHSYFYGLFNYLGASGTITNLRVLNCGINNLSGYSVGQGKRNYIGGLVGCSSGGIVSKCMVENFSVSTTDTVETISIAGIAAADTTISNCYIKNMSVGDCGNLSGITLKGSVSSSIVQNLSKNSVLNFEYNFTPNIATNCHNKANTTTGIDVSLNGGKEGTTWYYHEEYNDGWPCLRLFMTWQKVGFVSALEDPTAENGKYTISDIGGKVNKSEIYIPYGVAHGASNVRDTRVTILGQTVRALTNSGYALKEWKQESSVSYVAIFTNAKYKITFGLAEGEEFLTINGETEDIQYEVSVGTTLTFTFKDEFIKKEDGFITFKTCDIEIYKEGEIDETIIYEIKDSKHYISEKAINEKIILENNIFEVKSTTIFRVVKSNSMEYNATFE